MRTAISCDLYGKCRSPVTGVYVFMMANKRKMIECCCRESVSFMFIGVGLTTSTGTGTGADIGSLHNEIPLTCERNSGTQSTIPPQLQRYFMTIAHLSWNVLECWWSICKISKA